MELTPENALPILAELLKRTPMNNAEMIGAQCAINSLEKCYKELAELKNPSPKPTE